MVFLVEKHGPDTGLKSWSRGSKVLGICRTMLKHHHSSRLFLGLSRLLAFTCLYFPDLEVRDNARIYLRMLICIPGVKLRDLLNQGEQLLGTSQPTFTLSERNHCLLSKPGPCPCYLWVMGSAKAGYLESIRDSDPLVDIRDLNDSENLLTAPETERICKSQEPLRVMDSKISEILEILRRHFSCIPDFRHMPGFKVRISCHLRFESEPFNHIWGDNSPTSQLDGVDGLPAIYATVLQFSSSAPYGPIPSYRIPCLLGEPPRNDGISGQSVSLDIEPTPGLVDVSIEANAENGQVIRGQLQSITVGIEDMFLKAIIPSDIAEDGIPAYYSQLFNALWEACGTPSNIGRETFQLKGQKGVAAISGTRSVKLLEVPADSLIRATEQYLAPFVVSVIGEPLVNMVKDGGIISNIIWKDFASDSFLESTTSVTGLERGPLHLTYGDDDESRSSINISKRNMGCFFVLIFLPPRFHLLLQMEVSDLSTLVRIRTDYWPCLAYVDDYLEGLFLA
ncbi:hypothetical protein OIU76_013490 [Salix suchowensis]|nr:hypothetical protein OIU76_013490 [Salix suchowensis]